MTGDRALTCRQIDNFLMDWLDGKLGPRQSKSFEHHLSICAECVAYVDSYRKTVAMGKDAFARPHDTPPPEVPAELVQAIVRAARKDS